jgi:hypothetical protein
VSEKRKWRKTKRAEVQRRRTVPADLHVSKKNSGAIAFRYVLAIKTITSPFHNFLLALDVLKGQ